MNRSRKLVLLSHCILNPNSKVEGLVDSSSEDLVINLMKSGYGIIQLPCIEQDMCGIRRWGQVKEQLDHPNYRRRCRELLEPIVYQVKDFLNNGYTVAAVVGIDGSPSCGVRYTCSGDWSGEMGEKYGLMEKISTLKTADAPGVMMEELIFLFDREGIEVPFVSLDESDSEGSVGKVFESILSIGEGKE